MKQKLSHFLEWCVEIWKAILIGGLIGYGIGVHFTESQLYNDCRIAGTTRIGTSAFKCEQFSRAVLLVPEKVDKK